LPDRLWKVDTVRFLAALLRRLLQSHACASTVLVDELYAGILKRPPE